MQAVNDNTVVIPIGPQHPALKEPGNFTLTVEGEVVVGADVNVGYNHRGIEKLSEAKTYIQNLYLIERICGICSHAHTSCFAAAVEDIAGIQVPRRGQYIRTLIGELERIHSHFLWLGVAGHEIGFDTLLMYSWRDRELVMDVLAMISGNRVNYSMNTIGGVRRDLTPEMIQKTREAMVILEERTKYYIEVAQEESTFIARAKGVGRLPKDKAILFNAVGPTARASDLPRDVRKDDPYGAYGEIPFTVATADTADVFGRTVVRMVELIESYKIVRFILDNLPDGDIKVKAPSKIPAGEAVARYEAPRGEDIHYVAANGTDKPERTRVRAPTLANWTSMAHMLIGGYIADVPLVVAAIDPCFSCTDRGVKVVNTDGSARQIDWNVVRENSIDWYKNRGVDFSTVKLMEPKFFSHSK
ncbi:MAG: nickel-dependent hydrogenase large subunit [Spirochaetes bacterium]|nr:nickel-dependent hydrogenase large subunit [Spirochaetota bacterium]